MVAETSVVSKKKKFGLVLHQEPKSSEFDHRVEYMLAERVLGV